MSDVEHQEETKEGNQATKENAQTTIETGTVQDQNTISKEQNTISSSQNKSKKKKKIPSEIQVDSNSSLKKTKNKFKNAYSTQSLK